MNMIICDRINIAPFDIKYLEDYYSGFNAEITKFQWPDPFDSIDEAKSTLQEFLDDMDSEEALICSILSKQDDFIGSVEIHGLSEECPELGIWIIDSEHGKGYAYEALNAFLDYVRAKYQKLSFYYEADIRNEGSLKLLEKFYKNYEIIEKGLEELTTASGKQLKLQSYILKVK